MAYQNVSKNLFSIILVQIRSINLIKLQNHALITFFYLMTQLCGT